MPTRMLNDDDIFRRSYGFCESCGYYSPFTRANGAPYQESHYIPRCAEGEPDQPRTIIALCPNCHSKAHYGVNSDKFNIQLRHKARWVEDCSAKGSLKHVTAAITVDAQGRVLIAKRASGEALEDHWEFPGGKIEAGETMEECLRRELQEELELDVDIVRPFAMVDHDYGHFQIRLISLICTASNRKITLNNHSEYVWTEVDRLINYQLSGADHILTDHIVQSTTLL